MNDERKDREDAGPPLTVEQDRYATWLLWGTRVGLGLLVATFSLYVLDLVPAHVPIERLPEFWALPAGEYLDRTGVTAGWGWARFLHRADMINLAGVGLIASISIPCIAAVIPLFARRPDWVLVTICALEIAVLLLAASGLLAHH